METSRAPSQPQHQSTHTGQSRARGVSQPRTMTNWAQMRAPRSQEQTCPEIRQNGMKTTLNDAEQMDGERTGEGRIGAGSCTHQRERSEQASARRLVTLEWPGRLKLRIRIRRVRLLSRTEWLNWRGWRVEWGRTPCSSRGYIRIRLSAASARSANPRSTADSRRCCCTRRSCATLSASPPRKQRSTTDSNSANGGDRLSSTGGTGSLSVDGGISHDCTSACRSGIR